MYVHMLVPNHSTHTFERPLAIFSSVNKDDVSSDVGLPKNKFAILYNG